MRRASAASRSFLLAVAMLAGCSLYDPSLLVDAPPDDGNGGSDAGTGGSDGDAGEGGTDAEAGTGGTDGEAGEGGTDGEAGEGGSDGEAGEAGSGGEGGEAGSDGGEGGAAGTGGKGGAAGKSGAGGAPSGGSGGVAGKSGAGGSGGIAGKSGAGGAAGSTMAGSGGAAGATGGAAGSAGGGPCDGRVLINEVSIGKGSSDGDELVELYNPTGCEIVLTDWVLKYASVNADAWPPTATIWTGGAMAKIAPDGYFVIGNAAYVTGGGKPNEVGKLGMATSAGIGLFPTVSSATPVDSVAWGSVIASSPATETTPAKAPGTTKTIGRSASSADTNDNSADFTDQPRSPGAKNP